MQDVKIRKHKTSTVPEFPHMHERQTDFLVHCLKESECFLEYGAGGSTRLSSRSGVKKIYSVESDKKFARTVKDVVNSEALDSELIMNVPDIGATGAWGRPINSLAFKKWSSYSLDIWDEILKHGDDPDLILIDGRFRVACFFASLIHAKPGVKILFDDFVGRENKYGIVESVVPAFLKIEKMAVFEVPVSFHLKKSAAMLARYSCISD